MLQSDLCHWSKGTIIAEGTITVTDPNNNAYDKKLAFKDNSPFISCITKINNALIDNAEDLDIVLPMHNLIEQRKNYSKTSGGLCNYYRDESNSGAEGNINFSFKHSKSFNYKTSTAGELECIYVEKKLKILHH